MPGEMTMVERVARALFENVWRNPWAGPVLDTPNDLRDKTWLQRRDHYLRRARAAIEAMRDLPPGLVEAGASAAYHDYTGDEKGWPDNLKTYPDDDSFRSAYRAAHTAVIDAALSEEIANG